MIRKARRELALLAVKKNKIDIGTVVELGPAEFTESENSKFGVGRTVTLPEFRVPMFEDAADANLGDLRKLARCFLERCDICEFAKSDPHHLATFPQTQSSEIFRGE